jgi:hypothetical protein
MRNAALTPALLRTGRFVARLLRLGLPMGPLRIWKRPAGSAANQEQHRSS